jgi:hypothetical protein
MGSDGGMNSKARDQALFDQLVCELRNELASARLAFEVMKTHDELPAEGRAVTALERGLRRMAELLDQLEGPADS